MSDLEYSISDVYGFLDFSSDRKMSDFMPDAVSRIEESIKQNNPLKNKFYKHMKLKKLSEATNTLSSPTALSKDSLNSHSLEIEIEDGFIFDTRDHIYQHNIKMFDSSETKRLTKYQEYFNPTGRLSDLCFLCSSGPVGIKTLTGIKENLYLHYGFCKDKTRENFTDLSCNVVIVDIGKRSNIRISEEFVPNKGAKLYKILYLIRENTNVTIERSIKEGVQSIESKFIQFPGSSLSINSYNALDGYDSYTQEINEFEVWDDCYTQVNGKYLLEQDNVNNITCKVHHKGPGSYSNVEVKSTLEDTSHLSFLGEIIVDKTAVDTDAQLTNKNLQLSESATVVTEPQLDINTKEISCSHGCTVSNIDKDKLYALESRGIERSDARRILKECFLDLII